MSVTRLAIERNRVTLVALIVILLAGLSTYFEMPRAEDPDFIIRTALVTAYFPGASPERVEQLVTDKLEKSIQEMPELDFISSESKTGAAILFVNMKESYTEMRPIWDRLRRKVEKAVPDLPDGLIGPFVDDEFGDVFGTIILLTGEGYTYAELKQVADEVRDELLLIEEVAKVDVHGTQEERIFVEYNHARLAELGLSPVQLQQILASRNIIIPGGEVRTADEQIALEPSGNFESVEDLRRTIVKLPQRPEVIYLEDLAKVERGYIDPPARKMRTAGQACLGLAVSMRTGGNILNLGRQVKTTIDRVRNHYPIGIEFDYVQFQADNVDKKIKDFTRNLVQAVGIVILVMLLTLGIRTGLVVGSLIPMAIFMSLLVMGFLDIGLNQMSLASLIIALGMLVDNAIVMSESILVQMAGGKKPIEAAVGSASELAFPLLTSSLTTAAAFLPIYLAESATGEYTAPLFKVVTITLLCSWVLALTMIPMLCVMFLKVKKKVGQESFDTPFYRWYRGVLVSALKHRIGTLAVVAAVFFVTMQGFMLVPAIFFPPNDRPTLTVELRMPIGTPIERTEAVAVKVEQFIDENLKISEERPEGVMNWAAFIGQGAPRFILSFNPEMAAPEYAILLVNTSSREVVDVMIPKLQRFCFDNFPDLQATVKPLPIGPPVNKPVEIRISGRDADGVFDIVDSVKEKLGTIPGTFGIDDNWGARTKKLLVRINQPRARRAGVTNQDIAISLQTMLSGIETTQYREDDKVIPVTLRSTLTDRGDLSKLESLNVFAQTTGLSVPLKQVADVEVAWQPAKILRRNRLKTVTVHAELTPGVTAAWVNGQLRPWLEEEKKSWGLGYAYAFGGETEASESANESIAEKLPVAGLIIILLLVGQFNSLRKALIILITIPLGIIGVVVGLLVAKSYFGFMTLLGIISLAGIVINNAIVLLDRIRIEIEENGLEPAHAIIQSAQRRLRPILLTTCTTVCGLVPLWIGGGPMWEPMAISIIFGLLFATTLTLGVVPVLYSIFFRVKFGDFRYAGDLAGYASLTREPVAEQSG